MWNKNLGEFQIMKWYIIVWLKKEYGENMKDDKTWNSRVKNTHIDNFAIKQSWVFDI